VPLHHKGKECTIKYRSSQERDVFGRRCKRRKLYIEGCT